MRAGKDEHSLIGIRQKDLLIYTLGSRVKPDDSLFSFLDLFDNPASIFQHGDLNIIAQRRDVAFGFSLFQLSPQLTNNKSIIGFHREETRLGFNDETAILQFSNSPIHDPVIASPKGEAISNTVAGIASSSLRLSSQ